MAPIHIREERATDQLLIRNVTESAFRDRPYADGDEQDVIDRLRSTSMLTLSLVAVENDDVIGQITFSPAVVEDGSSPWFALGPISVLPARQGEGIGSVLVNEGLNRIEAMNALGCILTGDPRYYVRFGFQLSPKNAPTGEPEEYFQLKLLKGKHPTGRFSFDGAFYDDV